MFFDNPVKAFANLKRAAHKAAELHFIAWRNPLENHFMITAERAGAPLVPNMPARKPGAPGQFAFADRERVQRILDDEVFRRLPRTPNRVPEPSDARMPVHVRLL